jgi:DNA-binding GntR family transcriptional regulator
MSVESRLTSEEVYLELRRRILEHSLPPATRINIRALSVELGVSSTPVREALRQLQGDNLLVGTSNKGYATTDVLDVKGVRALFEFRLLVEPWAAATAAANRLANPAHLLKTEIASFDHQSGPINLVMIRHDNAFHHEILRASENEVLVDAYTRSHCHLHLFRAFRTDWNWERSLQQHAAIASAIEARNPEAAEAAMRDHLQDAYLGFIKGLKVEGEAALDWTRPELVIESSPRPTID